MNSYRAENTGNVFCDHETCLNTAFSFSPVLEVTELFHDSLVYVLGHRMATAWYLPFLLIFLHSQHMTILYKLGQTYVEFSSVLR